MEKKEIQDLFERLKDLLLVEKDLIVKAINDSQAVDQLNKVVEEKREVLLKLANYNPEDFKGFENMVREIQDLSKSNMILSQANLKFIESVFDSIFENASTYSTEGQIKKQSSSIINKKA
ncbi:hypothetical protein [Sulfurihydrogenibium azorense]|uniref:hypothetical protein n=1 Tax=Sulfurihydrogenibium azorense TaxID=309806 RepID=UPI002409A422|nr:hypothetical protein [Sulfurihydrogenibium azorense]MDM7272884.1 hypothetical protein [Sulfurihydrogenibium azorense]